MKKYVLIGAIVFIGAGVGFAPAGLIARGLAGVEDIELIEARGTVWRGGGRLLLQGHDLGRLTWRFAPATLIGLKLGHDWTLEHPDGPLTGTASAGFSTAYVTVNGVVAAAAVNPWLRPYDISLAGEFTLDEVALDIEHGSHTVEHVRGAAEWSGGTVGYTLGGLLQSAALPPLQAVLDTPSGKPRAIVRGRQDPTPLLVAELGDAGFVKVGITKRLTEILGNPWVGNAADDAVVLEVEEQFF